MLEMFKYICMLCYGTEWNETNGSLNQNLLRIDIKRCNLVNFSFQQAF